MTTLIDIAVITVDRPGLYIHRLLPGLRSHFPLRLVVGSPEVAYLECYRGNERLEILPPDKAEWARLCQSSIHRRASWNYWRGLELGPRRKDPRGLLLFEDDVIVARGWEQYLYETIGRIELQQPTGFVLALYCAYSLTPDPSGLFACYPPRSFYGTQAMYYPEQVRSDFAEYLYHHGVENQGPPYDLILNEYLRIRSIPLFASIPSLAQHIGRVSTGLGDFHQTHNFLETQ